MACAVSLLTRGHMDGQCMLREERNGDRVENVNDLGSAVGAEDPSYRCR